MTFKSNLKIFFLICLISAFSSCLKTRSDVGENEQSQVYSKKNVNNQQSNAPESQLEQRQSANRVADERDDLIRALNGRVENLENQIATANKDKSNSNSQETQKVALLQEALAKMEAQIQKLEVEQIQKKAAADAAAVAAKAERIEEPPPLKNGKKNVKDRVVTKPNEKNANSYDVAQGYFAGREWKKAILNYQKYTDDFPRGKEVSDAKYKIGVCFQELGMKEESMAFYEEVVANYSKTEAGKKAKIRLTKLKK